VDRRELSQEDTFVFCQAKESNSAVLSEAQDVSVSIGEHELGQDGIGLDLMLEDEGVRVINYHIVSIFTH
jgi:hypothetical protein